MTKKDWKTWSKAKKAENSVAEFLRSKGFTVSQVEKSAQNGLDIVAIKNNKHYFFDVKTPVFSSRCWRIKKSHKDADFVVWIMPNEEIYFQKANDKDLYITKLYDLYKNF